MPGITDSRSAGSGPFYTNRNCESEIKSDPLSVLSVVSYKHPSPLRCYRDPVILWLSLLAGVGLYTFTVCLELFDG